MSRAVIKIACLMGLLVVTSCQTSKKAKRISAAPNLPAIEEPDDDDEAELALSNLQGILTFNQKNPQFTSRKLRRARARRFAKELGPRLSPKAKDFKQLDYQAMLAARYLSGSGVNETLALAKRVVRKKLQKNVDYQINDYSRLMLGISALEKRQFALADYFLFDLKKSKNKSIRATVLNIDGLYAMEKGRFAEAMDLWQQALRADPGFLAARLNRGFLALRFGDLGTAKSSLAKVNGDWFATYGMLVAERLSGNGAGAKRLCNRILEQKPDYKPALLSCALNEYDSRGDAEAANDLLAKLRKSRFGPASVDRLADGLSQRMRRDKAEQKAKERQKKRERDEKEKRLAAEKKRAAAEAKAKKASSDDKKPTPTKASGKPPAKPPEGRAPQPTSE